ncbi:polysaccharide biosynthesis protein [Arthrobacter pigmenti]
MNSPLWPEALQRRGIQRNSPPVHFVVQGSLDAAAWIIACLAADLLLGTGTGMAAVLPALAITAVAAQLAIGWLLALYRNRHPYGGIREMRYVGLSVLVTGVVLLAATGMLNWPVPWQVLVVAALAAMVLMLASRHGLRTLLDRSLRPAGGARVVIVGAGETGYSLIRQMLRDKDSQYLPVALVDDDVAKRNVQVEGVPVRGTADQLEKVAHSVDAEGVIVAIGPADSKLLRRLNDQVEGTGIWIRTVPPLNELVNGQIAVSSIRELNVEDLIGRQPVSTDLERIRHHIAGRRVLVTGAGGSIGSELCRQLHELDPDELIMLDRDESALHALQMSIHGRALMDTSEVVLADIRDPEALEKIFRHRRPEVVFHAAALKHLPMLEQYPQEGWKTNVHGTLNVLEASRDVDVEYFVNISTDKAANPTSVLGKTKRIAERLTASFASTTGRSYLSVRFGNVLGSRGSVLLSFQEQISNGGPLTVTHPDVTRYFMTIPEACQLVLQAAVAGRSGETLVLDMGEPVRIVDIARRLMDLANRRCEIIYTGLRAGEKLDEDLFTQDEAGSHRSHEKISHALVPGLAPSSLPAPAASLRQVQRLFDIEASESGQLPDQAAPPLTAVERANP